MIVELRRYHIKPNLRDKFWSNYKNSGLPVQLKYLKDPVGFYFTDIGEICEFVHIWRYQSIEEREQCRNQLHTDSKWKEYVKTALPFINTMKTSILRELEY